MSNPFVLDENGKPIFTGKEDPSNPRPKPPSESSRMECPICHEMVDYLVGENTQDGGLQGCEGCWKPSSQKPSPDGVYDKDKEIL